MASPFKIFSIMFTARRPSKVLEMRAVSIPFWLRKGYDAVTFFGTIITNDKADADRYNQAPHPVKYHETIHLRQAQSTHNSWLCFYWKYMIFWFQARRANRILPNAGYELNPFEMEAYANMYNPHYLERFGDEGATGWKQYEAMTLAQRFRARRKYSRD